LTSRPNKLNPLSGPTAQLTQIWRRRSLPRTLTGRFVSTETTRIRRNAHEDREFVVDAARRFTQLESLANNLLLCEFLCASGEIGRRASLRGWWGKTRAGSSPVLRTPLNEEAVVPEPRPLRVSVISDAADSWKPATAQTFPRPFSDVLGLGLTGFSISSKIRRFSPAAVLAEFSFALSIAVRMANCAVGSLAINVRS
jgi:hypothetical protein